MLLWSEVRPRPWVEQKPVRDHLPFLAALSWITRWSVFALEGEEAVVEFVMPLVRSCLMRVSFVEVSLERAVFVENRFSRTAFLLIKAWAMLSR